MESVVSFVGSSSRPHDTLDTIQERRPACARASDAARLDNRLPARRRASIGSPSRRTSLHSQATNAFTASRASVSLLTTMKNAPRFAITSRPNGAHRIPSRRCCARCGKTPIAMGAMEERLSDLLFQSLDLAADRRLRNKQFLCRSGKAQVTRGNPETAQ
jgi:hypothetical protein